MISVVIPLFNKENHIEKAIGSVLRQTYPDFELVIVNDGSTDRSLNRVMNFKDNRLKVINQPNSGVSLARNKGVQNTRFEYVAFLDADDWWEPDFLSEMKKAIHSFPGAGLYGCRYQVVKNGLNRTANIGIDSGFDIGYIDYFQVYARTFWVPINCSFVVVEKSAFWAVGGFNPVLKFGEDFDLWVRIALFYKIAYVNKFLAYSNQDVHPGQRALGERLWKKEEHFIFNLDYLEEEENKNPILKTLLDGLRVRSLSPFYLKKQYEREVYALLSNVDIARQPHYYRFLYQTPRPLVILFVRARKIASLLKQTSIKWLRPR